MLLLFRVLPYASTGIKVSSSTNFFFYFSSEIIHRSLSSAREMRDYSFNGQLRFEFNFIKIFQNLILAHELRDKNE